MSSATQSAEFKIKAALIGAVLVILTLLALLTHAWGWSLLAIFTLLFVVSYPLSWIGWRIWRFWSSSIMRITVYTQSLAMGESGVGIAQRTHSALLDDLTREITRLHQQQNASSKTSQLLSVLFSQLFEDLPLAVIAFNRDFKLTYANHAAYAINDISLLRGMLASELGFVADNEQVRHPALGAGWRCQSSRVSYLNQTVYLFTAIDITHELKQSEQAVQNNLVRVLSHELRNTLTPMSSMTETLLSMQTWDNSQIRTVLERIRTRSEGLLHFVDRFSQVAKIPQPKKEHFDIHNLVEQTRVLLRAQDALTFIGQHNCYADQHLLAQVLMNLVKNAVESQDKGTDGIQIEVSFYQKDALQWLTVVDNGPGFSNIDNALTPLYTTKTEGAGIGLAFVETVMSKHGGKVRLSNHPSAGAKVELSWPSQGEPVRRHLNNVVE